MKRWVWCVALWPWLAQGSYSARFTAEQWNCVQPTLAFLKQEGILRVDCREEHREHLCRFTQGKQLTGGLFSKARYQAFEDLEGNLRIKLYPSYGRWSQYASHEVMGLLNCEGCLQEVEEDCHCKWPKGTFRSEDDRFQALFCVHYMGLTCPEQPNCGKKPCKPVEPVPTLDFATEIRLYREDGGLQCTRTR